MMGNVAIEGIEYTHNNNNNNNNQIKSKWRQTTTSA